jgi:hypothetical protein
MAGLGSTSLSGLSSNYNYGGALQNATPNYKNYTPYSVLGAGTSSVQPQTQTKTPTTGGGGGTGSIPTGTNNNTNVSNPNPQTATDDSGAIDSYFNEANGMLDQMAQQYQPGSQYGQQLESSFTNPLEAQRPGLESAYQQGNQLNQQQVGTAQSSYQNVMDAAKRLYSELQNSFKSRFGSASGTGQYAQTLLANNFQQGQGQNYQTFQSNIQNLDTQKAKILSEYTAGKQQLDMAISNAKNQAQMVLSQALQSINSQKFGLAQDKANAKLTELQNYKNRIYQIQDSATAFERQLQANAQQAALQLQTNIGTYKAMANTPATTAGQSNVDLPTATTTQDTTATPQVTGQVDWFKKLFGGQPAQ